MKNLVLASALLAAGLFALQGVSSAHGGQYRGPGDTVPPGGGGGTGGGPSTPGPAGPSTPGPSGPSTPGPAGPTGGGPAAPITAGGGGASGPDLTVWTFWWEFNKEPYLNLKSHIHSGDVQTGSDGFFLGRGEKQQGKDSLRPTEDQIRQKVVPALKNALENESNNDILTGCLIALAKIGDTKSEEGTSEFEPIISAFLADGVQEVSETAAVALGILANDRSVQTLADLLFDTPEGRKAVKAGEVKTRTRAFAAYGLGLIGARTTDEATRLDVVNRLVTAIRDDSTKTRDLKVACLISIGLVPLETFTPPDVADGTAEEDVPAITCRVAQLDYLLEYMTNEDNRYLVRAHAPTALGRLLAGLPPEIFDEYKPRVARALIERMSKKAGDKVEVVQSAILALGLIGDADNDSIDKEIRKALAAVPKEVKKPQARYFGMIAMAKVGGTPGSGQGIEDGIKEANKFLLDRLVKGKSQDPAWAGLAIGVMGRMLGDAQVTSASINDMTAALRDSLRSEKSAEKVGAFALGAGILGDIEATDAMLDRLAKISDAEARGYIAVGLGLMNAREAIEPIQKIVESSKYRPALLQQTAIALGLLGDKELVPKLIDMLGDAKGLATQAAISSALGFIGDQRSIDPLVGMLENDDITTSARGFAAVALGIVADKETLPWNSKIAVDLNYRASTTTLNDMDGTGILNIL
jgi:HEAT repeat protein